MLYNLLAVKTIKWREEVVNCLLKINTGGSIAPNVRANDSINLTFTTLASIANSIFALLVVMRGQNHPYSAKSTKTKKLKYQLGHINARLN